MVDKEQKFTAFAKADFEVECGGLRFKIAQEQPVIFKFDEPEYLGAVGVSLLFGEFPVYMRTYGFLQLFDVAESDKEAFAATFVILKAQGEKNMASAFAAANHRPPKKTFWESLFNLFNND